jgi:hypothetical protein
VLALYGHDRHASTEKAQNMGVGLAYNHNCLSFKANVGKIFSGGRRSRKHGADRGLQGSDPRLFFGPHG